MRVAALTWAPTTASSRFRIRQHIKPLLSIGISVTDYPLSPITYPIATLQVRKKRLRDCPHFIPAYALGTMINFTKRLPAVFASHAYDITWVSRNLFPGYPTIERLINSPFVLDIDDAIWLNKPFGESSARRAALAASMIVVGNDYLADWYSQFNDKIKVVPTAVDASIYIPKPKKEGSKFVVGWIGSAENYPYLYAVEPALFKFFSAFPNSQLLIIAERPPSFASILRENVRFQYWSAFTEAALIQEMNVGIMPLQDTPWGRGKCSFKMLQYMSCGIPVVASPVGMNREVFSHGAIGVGVHTEKEWFDALEYLYVNDNVRLDLGQRGREVILQAYDKPIISHRLARIFESLL